MPEKLIQFYKHLHKYLGGTWHTVVHLQFSNKWGIIMSKVMLNKETKVY